MSGHSKWSTIKRKKGKADAAKGVVFTKLAREIIMAARAGGGNPEGNFRLRIAVTNAKAANMPNENIKRAIEKGSGGTDGANFEELTYEGYGPGGTAVIVRAMTDNRNRTAGEIRHIFSKNGGNMGETGCVSWMFKEKGILTIERDGCKFSADDIMLMALELGADDMEEDADAIEIITAPDVFQAVKEGMEKEGVLFSGSEITMVSENAVVVTDLDQAKYVLRMMEALDDHDDVQNTFTNFDVPDEIADKLA